MPGKAYHEVLVWRKVVWLSISFDEESGMQRWRVYRRPHRRRGGYGPWWKGLIQRGNVPRWLRNEDLTTPILRAYAFTVWSWDLPNGTNLWVQDNAAPNQFQIWYSPLHWRDFLNTGEQGWTYMGIHWLHEALIGLKHCEH